MNPGQYITPNLKLVRKIGQGAMGEVWLAEQLALGSSVAVKLMGSGIGDDERALARFGQLTISPDGRYLVLAFADETLQVQWPLDSQFTEKLREG